MKKEYFLGIDVSKGYADFILLNDRLEPIESCFQMDDTSGSYKMLEQFIDKYFKLNPGLTLYAGFESTGGYERNWHRCLLALTPKYDLKVARVNPVAIKGISKASLNRSVTDETSAMNIATYMAGYKSKLDFSTGNLDESFQDARSIYTYYKMLSKQDTQLKNQLEKLLYQSLSDILIYCRRGVPMWLLRLLSKYPSAQSINKAGIAKLKDIKGVSEKRALAILSKLEHRNNKTSGDLAFVIKETVREILHKEERKEEIEQYLIEKYGKHRLVKLLTSIKGIGTSTAIFIMLEIEDINRFRTVKQIVAYFGINPEFKQSGDGITGKHMSKKGRKGIRGALYMPALAAMKCDPMMKELYFRFRAMGKNHYFTMGVLIHKLLRIIYGILKSEKPYDIRIDQANREKSLDKQKNIEELEKEQMLNYRKKKRRYQVTESWVSAPISARKNKILKELETSLSTKSAFVQDHLQPEQK